MKNFTVISYLTLFIFLSFINCEKEKLSVVKGIRKGEIAKVGIIDNIAELFPYTVKGYFGQEMSNALLNPALTGITEEETVYPLLASAWNISTDKLNITYIINAKYNNLSELNITLIKYLCNKLEIKTPIYIQSELKKDFGKKNYLNLNICKYFNADVYLSGSGAAKYNDVLLFKENGIELVYDKFVHPIYPQLWGDFIPNLSIIDLLFNCGPESKLYMKKN